jgi:hypothetical protein
MSEWNVCVLPCSQDLSPSVFSNCVIRFSNSVWLASPVILFVSRVWEP